MRSAARMIKAIPKERNMWLPPVFVFLHSAKLELTVLTRLGAVCELRVGDAAKHGNARFAEDVFDDRFFETRSVVVEMQQVRFLVETEFLEAVSIGKISERAKLFGTKLFLEFVGHGHECHGRIIAGEKSHAFSKETRQ